MLSIAFRLIIILILQGGIEQTKKAKYVQFVIDVTASKQSDYYNRTKFRYIFADLKLKDPKYITKVDLLNAPFTKKSY